MYYIRKHFIQDKRVINHRVLVTEIKSMYDALLQQQQQQQQQAQQQQDAVVESATTTTTPPALVGVEELKLPGLTREVHYIYIYLIPYI